ncbi:MAG: PAS domain S-box protein [bacterium]|nr:PAS domain S-box protein [bacterium]
MPERKKSKKTKSVFRKKDTAPNSISDQVYFNFINEIPIGIYRTTPDGKILFANTALVRMLGYTSFAELAARNLEDGFFEPTYSRQQFKEIMEQKNEIKGLEYSWVRRDKSVILVRENAKAVRDETGKIIYYEGTIEDITEHKLAEEALAKAHAELEQKVRERTQQLQEEERFLSGIFNSVQDGISILDKEMRILRVNPTMERWYAHAMPLLGKKCYQAYHGRNEPCDICPSVQALATKRTAYEVVPKRGAGGVITGWLDLYSFPLFDQDSGTITGVIEYVRDITARKQAEQQQKTIIQGLRAILAIADELIMEPDLDVLYRRAVELGRDKLGLERCSLYLEEGDKIVGTYGTNLQGQTTDERCFCEPITQWKQYLQPEQPNELLHWLLFEEPLREWIGETMAVVGTGWLVATPIKSVRTRLGVFFNDAAITGAPFDPAKQEIVAVYCSLLGSIIERKQAVITMQENQRRFQVLFENSPISIWEGDFSAVKSYLTELRNSGVTDFATYFASRPDEVMKCAGMINVMQVNQATIKLYQAKNIDEFRSGLSTYLCPESYPIFIEELIALAEGKPEFETETINQTLTGEKIHIFLRWSIAPGHEQTANEVVVSIIDITERKKIEAALRESESRLRTIIENQGEGIVMISPDERILFTNPAGAEIFGLSVEQCIGRNIEEFIIPEDIELLRAQTAKRRQGERSTYVLRFVNPEGERRYLLVTATPQFDTQHQFAGAFAIFRDITDRIRLEEQLRALSLIDDLTGLYNRRGFLTLAEQQIKIAHRLEKRMLLLFADIDNMKWINDTYGHQEGDRALINTTTILRETFRESDIIARIGGDEFVILAIEIDAASAEILTSRLQENLDTYNAQENQKYKLALSIGISRYVPESPRPLDELLEQADKLMYEQKRKKQSGYTSSST